MDEVLGDRQPAPRRHYGVCVWAGGCLRGRVGKRPRMGSCGGGLQWGFQEAEIPAASESLGPYAGAERAVQEAGCGLHGDGCQA